MYFINLIKYFFLKICYCNYLFIYLFLLYLLNIFFVTYVISNYLIFSSFYLTLNENSSQISFHDVSDPMNYKHLLRIPTCPHNLYLKIKDIYFSGKEMSGKWCSLLVAVRCVSTYCVISIPN